MPKPPSIEVTRWMCSVCDEDHQSATEADACCICKCGRVIPRADQRKWGLTKCPRCTLKDSIRANQDALRRHEANITSTRATLDRLQAEKRSMDAAEKRGPPLRLAVED